MQDDGLDATPREVAESLTASRRRRKLTHGIILSGWVLTILTMVSIIGAALWLMVARDFAKLPEELAQWCGIALGFLFGTFTSIVKDFITDPPE